MDNESPCADWWCENCETTDHPTESSLCPYLTPEQRERLNALVVEHKAFPHNKRIMRANRPRGFVWGAHRRVQKD